MPIFCCISGLFTWHNFESSDYYITWKTEGRIFANLSFNSLAFLFWLKLIFYGTNIIDLRLEVWHLWRSLEQALVGLVSLHVLDCQGVAVGGIVALNAKLRFSH